MINAIYPLLSAATFATSSVMMKKMDTYSSPINLNFYRALVGGIFFTVHLLIAGLLGELLLLNLLTILFLVLSVLFNVVLGDTSYFASQEKIGVKISTPIINTYPIFTIILAYFLLDEQITIAYIGGTLVIIIGIILLSQGTKDEVPDKDDRVTGFILAFISVLLYAVGVLMVTIASTDTDPVVANSIRLPAATLLLFMMRPFSNNKDREYEPKGKKFMFMMIITGILGTYLSSLFLVISAQKLGAGMTSVLTSLGPLFALPMAFFWLKEKITKSVIFGTVLTIFGLFIVLLL